MPTDGRHIPVLYSETLASLLHNDGAKYIDCTLGAAGHAAGLLESSGPTSRLLGLDADPEALALAGEKLARFGDRVTLVNSNFANLAEVARDAGFDSVDGILFDLGISSMQIDEFTRGFSFRRDEPLDMRFDPKQVVTAADLINDADEAELRRILYEYGEERYAPRIVRAIARRRAISPIRTTGELVAVIAATLGTRRDGINSATKTFQALRIAVNSELDNLKTALPQAVDLLSQGGRLAVISFHSLEDRIVKHFIRDEAVECVCPPGLPVCVCGRKPRLKPVTKKAIVAGPEETNDNPRARSAKLRVAEKIS